jgi:hypothetical protein
VFVLCITQYVVKCLRCAPYVSMVVIASYLCLGRSLLAVTCCVPCLLVMIIVVASCWLSGGDVESSVSVTSTRAHTL